MNEVVRISESIHKSKKETKIAQTQKTDFSRSTNSPVDRILFLQRTIGNQAVQKLVKSGALQAKLEIGQPGDIYEQEADRVAEQVVSMPASASSQPSCQGKGEVQTKPLSASITPAIQPKANSSIEVGSELESSLISNKGGGSPLPENVRAYFEPRFGVDFSQVRAHSD